MSKEDQNAVGESGVSEDQIGEWKGEVERWFEGLIRESNDGGNATTGEGSRQRGREIRICVMDGFLALPPSTIRERAGHITGGSTANGKTLPPYP